MRCHHLFSHISHFTPPPYKFVCGRATVYHVKEHYSHEENVNLADIGRLLLAGVELTDDERWMDYTSQQSDGQLHVRIEVNRIVLINIALRGEQTKMPMRVYQYHSLHAINFLLRDRYPDVPEDDWYIDTEDGPVRLGHSRTTIPFLTPNHARGEGSVVFQHTPGEPLLEQPHYPEYTNRIL